jgi:hypothetical protein
LVFLRLKHKHPAQDSRISQELARTALTESDRSGPRPGEPLRCSPPRTNSRENAQKSQKIHNHNNLCPA